MKENTVQYLVNIIDEFYFYFMWLSILIMSKAFIWLVLLNYFKLDYEL